MIFDRKQQLNQWNDPFDICLNQGRLVVWIWEVGGWVRMGKLSKKLKREWNSKEGRGNKDFKKGGGGGLGQARSRGGCLKKGGGLNPLRTMVKPPYFFVMKILCLTNKYNGNLCTTANQKIAKWHCQFPTLTLG